VGGALHPTARMTNTTSAIRTRFFSFTNLSFHELSWTSLTAETRQQPINACHRHKPAALRQVI
jgi:hypothetical protein